METEQESLAKAFNKELFLIKNDLYYQQVDLHKNGKHELLRLDISYKPHSELSGDTYSLRKTKDGRLVGFVADAMGKGITAAISAMGLTRFLNYFFDELEDEGTFVFDMWVHKTLKFLQKNLFNEEIICLALMEFDMAHSLVRYASCGMPAFYAQLLNGEVIDLKSNNPPLGSYSEKIEIKTLISTQVQKMICYTDGLSESSMSNGKPYSFLLKEDFQKAVDVIDFRQRVETAIGKGEDDLTYVHIQKLDFRQDVENIFVPSTYEAVDDVLHSLALYLKSHRIESKQSNEVLLALSELLMNALEHGSFGVNKARKNYLIEHNLFDDEMIKLESLNQSKMIHIRYGMLPRGEQKLFELCIEDEGEGFNTHILKELVINPHTVSGRGFFIVKKLLDHFYFNEQGNSITIQKLLQQGSQLQ